MSARNSRHGPITGEKAGLQARQASPTLAIGLRFIEREDGISGCQNVTSKKCIGLKKCVYTYVCIYI